MKQGRGGMLPPVDSAIPPERQLTDAWAALVPRLGCPACSETVFCVDCDRAYQRMSAAVHRVLEAFRPE